MIHTLLWLTFLVIRIQALYPNREMTAGPSKTSDARRYKSVIDNQYVLTESPLPTISSSSSFHQSSYAFELANTEHLSTIEQKTSNHLAATESTDDEFRSAWIKTMVTVACAFSFGIFLTFSQGKNIGYEFFCGYLIEQSLSIDNLFVFMMLFQTFQVPQESQQRVIEWGIASAIALRGVMILAGIAILAKFRSVLLLFSGILLVSSYHMWNESTTTTHAQDHDNNNQLGHSSLIQLASKWIPRTLKEYQGNSFFVRKDGVRYATPLFLCLICVELSDFVFAVDSIPAVLGISQNPLVVYSSNIFAILGLRSLYTVIAKAVSKWKYLKPAVAMVLGFVAIKMMLEYFHLHIFGIDASLGIISMLLGMGIVCSLLEDYRQRSTMASGNYNL
jgi:TerC family integral membrane protein